MAAEIVREHGLPCGGCAAKSHGPRMSNPDNEKTASYFSFKPKLIESLKGYNRERFFADLGAGTTVGIVALPLAIGLGIASGVDARTGLFTAIIGGLIVSLFGGSRVQVGGPAGAFVGMVYGIVNNYGLGDLLLCTLMAGVILYAFGTFGLGTLIKFIPHPVTTGFTCGIAITIMSTQVKDFLGLPLEKQPAEFGHKLVAIAGVLPQFNPYALGIALLSLCILILWPRYGWRKLPGSIIAVVVSTLLVYAFKLPVGTIGAIPRELPGFPAFNWSHIGDLVRPAFAIALLGGIESLLSAVVSDGMIDDRHDSNQELKAQGLANMLSPLVGGIPVTGVIARTATNVRNGANSPVAGIIHALVLLLIVLIAAPLAAMIPYATLAAVLMMVAYNMGEWDEFTILKRMPMGDAAVFVITFGLTVLFDLTVAVEVGMVLAAGLFIKRVTETTHVAAMDDKNIPGGQGHESVTNVPDSVIIYRVFGALLFGAADKLDSVLRRASTNTRVVILHMAAVTALDGTALNALQTMHQKLRRHGKHLILSGPHTQPYFLMEKSGFLDEVGADNIGHDLESSLVRARALIAEPTKAKGHTRPPLS
jgi:SulP family sulfate permease